MTQLALRLNKIDYMLCQISPVEYKNLMKDTKNRKLSAYPIYWSEFDGERHFFPPYMPERAAKAEIVEIE
jgi:hypothetical protein